MGIKSTREITRESAIERISKIIKMINEAEWVDLHDSMYGIEDHDFLDNFVNEYNDIDKEYNANNKVFKSIDKWPNKMLEEFMDKRGIRYSIFENYIIKG
jgi:hypothetical protein